MDGDIHLAGFSIGSETKLSQLPACFVIGEERQCPILGETVSTQFATAQMEGAVNLQLRFEEGVLVSVFIKSDAIDGRYETDDEFYGGVDKRVDQYNDWLKRHIDFEIDQFKGGSMGVAKDKSENVFVYIHNKNNSWANQASTRPA